MGANSLLTPRSLRMRTLISSSSINAVAEDEDVDLLLLDHPTGYHADFLQRLRQALLATRDAEQRGQHAHLEAGEIGAADFRKFLVGQHGPLQIGRAHV